MRLPGRGSLSCAASKTYPLACAAARQRSYFSYDERDSATTARSTDSCCQRQRASSPTKKRQMILMTLSYSCCEGLLAAQSSKASLDRLHAPLAQCIASASDIVMPRR